MAKDTRLTDMIKQSKSFIKHLEERKTACEERKTLIASEIAVKQTAKKNIQKDIDSIEKQIKEEQAVLEKLEA